MVRQGRSSFEYQKKRYRSLPRLRAYPAQNWIFLLLRVANPNSGVSQGKAVWLVSDRAVELPSPASSTVTVSNSVDPKTATSRIKVAAGEANAVVQLFDRETDAHVISVYVSRNEDVSMPVPPGIHRMKIIEGASGTV